MKVRVETSLEDFLERWIEFTGDYDDFVPADNLWLAMVHAAALPQDSRRVWGLSRKEAFDVMRVQMPEIPRQRMRYCRAVPRPPGAPSGSTRAGYEGITLSKYAIEVMEMPIRVQRREHLNKYMRAPRKIAANG